MKKNIKDKFNEVYKKGDSVLINGEKWGVCYNENFECFLIDNGTDIIYLYDEDLDNLEKNELITFEN